MYFIIPPSRPCAVEDVLRDSGIISMYSRNDELATLVAWRPWLQSITCTCSVAKQGPWWPTHGIHEAEAGAGRALELAHPTECLRQQGRMASTRPKAAYGSFGRPDPSVQEVLGTE